MDQLLDGHANLLNTQEGRVFDSFHQQLNQQTELTEMRHRIRPSWRTRLRTRRWMACSTALRLLVQQLIKEAKVVQAVRARSEREVSQFMKTGQAAENQRVGQLLNDVLEQALRIDWQRQAVRRQSAPLPPLGVALGSVPLVERLRIKSLDGGDAGRAAAHHPIRRPGPDGSEFWQAFEGLDREAWCSAPCKRWQTAASP
jgi:hypothetical protein